MHRTSASRICRLLPAMLVTFSPLAFAQPQPRPKPVTGPWMNKSLSPDERADLLVQSMTLDEKLGLVHGFRPSPGPLPAGASNTRSIGGRPP
jgi:beta-glucosidase